MSAEHGGERPHPASPHKLERARRQGQVPRSVDAVAAAVIAVALAWLAARGTSGLQALLQIEAALIRSAGHASDPARLASLLADSLLRAGLLLMPLMLSLMLVAVLVQLAQHGPLFAPAALSPDAQRLSPKQALERLFSAQGLVDLARSLLKLALVGAVGGFAIASLRVDAARLWMLAPREQLHFFVDRIASVGWRVVAMLAVLALLDWGWQQHRFAQRLRMSPQELKDEIKQREGDPRVRARRRELQREARRRAGSVHRTQDADVLITNPTRLALALRYEHGAMSAPRLVAKGAGPLARVMRDIAARHHIPVVQNPPLARRMFRSMSVDGELPPALYAEVARIMVWVLAARRRLQGDPAA